jgi:phosphoribosyl 1,2-cyclic phosphodiesterase
VVFAGLASGSRGNSWVFQHETSAILIECGLSYRQLRKRFDSIDVSPYDVSACLLSHAHGDHHQAIRSFVKKHGPVIFCTSGCFQGIPWLSERPDLVSLLDVRGTVEIDGFTIKAMPTIHDSEGCVSFSISAGGYKVAMALETGRITAEMAREAADADVVVVEANHDPQLVAESVNKGEIPQSVGLSILSRHLSNESAGRFLARAPLPKCQLAILSHLSAQRNRPELALETVRAQLRETGREMEVIVSPQDEPTPLIDVSNLDRKEAVHRPLAASVGTGAASSEGAW